MATPGVKSVLLPRNKVQESHIRASWPKWFEGDKVIVPKEAVDGLNLLWHSDLVVSGGGTMNREAAALGILQHLPRQKRRGGSSLAQRRQDGARRNQRRRPKLNPAPTPRL
ncbi:DUF354 domain-containing protein [Bradyrhizobium valentinum]|nr:DUF354 domain-containing protein [Bradyrhizobium valentinum]